VYGEDRCIYSLMAEWLKIERKFKINVK
jgi:hypothetical protein